MARPQVQFSEDGNTGPIFERAYPPYGRLSGKGSISYAAASAGVRVLFESSAAFMLLEEVQWGGRPDARRVRQAGLLIGNVYRDTTGQPEVIWANVVTIVPANPSLVRASPGSIDIPSTAWKLMIDEASTYETENLRVLGWYHTHLNRTPAHFSEKDRRTHRAEFAFEHSIGVVLNPNQRQWSAVYGPNALACSGEFAYGSDIATQFRKPPFALPEQGERSAVVDEHPVEFTQGSVRGDLGGQPRPLGESAQETVRQWLGVAARGVRQISASLRTGVDYGARSASPSRETFAGNQDDAPVSAGRIKIMTPFTSTQPVIKSMMYTESPDRRLVPLFGFQVLITDKALETILRSRQEPVTRIHSLWARLQQAGTTLVLTLVQKRDANASVVATNGAQLTAISDHLASREFDRSVEYFVGIDEATPQQVRVRIIQLATGATHERAEDHH